MGIQADLEAIARDHLNIETLESRNMDSLDFHEVSVQAVQSALLAAWLGGIEEAEQQRQDNTQREDETMSEQLTLECDGRPNIRFTGEKIAGTANSADRGHSDFSGSTGRWTTLRLYRTEGGSYVCHRIGHTLWQGEHETNDAEVCTDLDGVFAFFGYGSLAKDLYAEAGIEAVQSVA